MFIVYFTYFVKLRSKTIYYSKMHGIKFFQCMQYKKLNLNNNLSI